MQRMAWITLAAVLFASATIMTAAPASQPTNDQADLRATVEALQQKLKEQDKKIAELEARQNNDQKVRREEIVAVLKEMKLTGDKKAEDLRAYYKDGLKFETGDGNFRLGLNGRIFADIGWIGGSDLGKQLGTEQKDYVEIRELRINMSGTIYKDFFYTWEMDFAHEKASIKDAFFGMKNIPVVGNVRVGHFKEPFGLENLLSDSATTFMEKALPFALEPDRSVGIMANNDILNQRMTWAIGMFRDTGPKGDPKKVTATGGVAGDEVSDSGYNLTGRLTGLPYYENSGKQLLHLGASYSYRTLSDQKLVAYSAKPESDFASAFIATGNVPATNVNLFGAEAATVWNSFHAESEFVASRVNTIQDDNPCYKGMYAQAGYFLTGETRPYDKATGNFTRLRPLKNFREKGGLGAWEIAARYSFLGLNEHDIGGNRRGEMDDATVGLNWYLNPMIRVMWNYIHSMPDTPVIDGSADIFMMRFQIDF